jgi:putative ABC transport system permease protein
VSLVQLLPVSYTERMERLPGVAAVAHATWFGGVYQDPKNFFGQFPVEPEGYLAMFPEMIVPPAERAAFVANRTGAMAGRKTAERFGWKVGDRIPIEATIWQKADGSSTWEFDLEAIYSGAEAGTDETGFFFHYDYFEEARAYGKGAVGWYTVRVADPDRSEEVARAVDAEFANSSAETKTETEKAFVQGFANQVGDVGAILSAVLGAVFFTILLVAGNTMAQSVRERIQELAVLKALGFTHQGVLALVLAEAAVIAGVGGVLGLGLARVLTGLGDPTGGALPVFFFPLADQLLGVVFVVLLGLATGVLPALQAMRLQIADGLRR